MRSTEWGWEEGELPALVLNLSSCGCGVGGLILKKSPVAATPTFLFLARSLSRPKEPRVDRGEWSGVELPLLRDS